MDYVRICFVFGSAIAIIGATLYTMHQDDKKMEKYFEEKESKDD